jgi:hypothetical protein
MKVADISMTRRSAMKTARSIPSAEILKTQKETSGSPGV